jgi:hypothetical protein
MPFGAGTLNSFGAAANDHCQTTSPRPQIRLTPTGGQFLYSVNFL